MEKGKETTNEEERPVEVDEGELTNIELSASTVSRGLIDDFANDNLLGKIVRSEEEAYTLYNEYAYEKGFSIRKAKSRYYEGTRLIRQKEYVCSKEGFKEDPTPSETPSYNRLDVRTGCKAMIRFTVKDDEWKVTHFIAEHNHELASTEERHLLRSARNFRRPKPRLLNSVETLTLTTENTGFVQRDQNPASEQNLVFIEGGDAQSLCQWFKKKKNGDIMFFHDVQLDQEGRVTNFFWCDGRSRIDYGYFGDVVVFDTTYRINKYNLICAPFFGINHHRAKVMFGCAFLLDETSTSFIWLFKSFLESMGNKAPRTIVTYQDDAALIQAVEEVFPDTSHIICPWHIVKKASSHLAGLYSNPAFAQLFRKCVQQCNMESEFEETWQRMVEEYDCKNHSWLKTIYRYRQKWSTAFSSNSFSCGVISSQRNECVDIFGGISSSKITCLTRFAIEVDELVARWRDSELKSNFRCKQGAPPLVIKKSSICHQAAQIYTHKIFELFEQEYLEGVGALRCTELSSSGTLCTYRMVGDMDDQKEHIVQFDSSALNISCSCKKFECMGILCSHCLSCLHMKNVNAIPHQYILKRWTKSARDRAPSHDLMDTNRRETEVEYHTEMMRWAYDMITRSQKSPITRVLLRDSFRQIDQELKRVEADLELNVANNAQASGNSGKRKKNASNESLKSRKINDRAVDNSVQANAHANIPFDIVNLNQGSIDLSTAPFYPFSPQYLQHAHFAAQEAEQFQRNN
ncbi:protein FAR1-RELATED SEQUENCE 5-like [Punica granatum]|uniref:SWIM-type domain-containing protein n=2 Tax=Punica granatum TaxID=22663 RepID=A0A218XHZ1_PUNGR|nr:protein FAR1-RELATED SEQUENCE 5-like [Punica granatum]XP_031373254.1 protein FAR1-RELATED SEQUENCE 5-like [Punica granatum]XP_031373255.1 protein FAR1-RELATED SEQUENCE 5-like [Punica granatum]OWM84071.1 hypothetical protein CDL15_Pgr009318 [Punica granatum]PKI76029.1 hypothetical protein CRG98_003579 [Punica granatum]